MLTKSREVTRPNVIDVATWLFKYDEFEDAADSFAIQVKFRREFKLTNSEYETLFEFRDEPADHIFSSDPLSKEDVASVVNCRSSLLAPP